MDILTRVGLYFAVLVMAFGTGFVKGCQHESAKYKEAETKFITRTEQLVKVERVEVPKYITKVETIETIRDNLIKEAANAPANPAACDLDPDRVRRINLAATAGR